MKRSHIKKMLLVALLVVAMAQVTTEARAEDEPRAQYKIGEGLFIGNGENLFHIQGRVQGRFTYTVVEAAADTDFFSLNRGEIRIDGHILDKKLKYGFEMNLGTRARATTVAVCQNTGGTATANCPGGTTNAVTVESTSGLATLNDYYIDWVPASYIAVQGGQFKVPFLFQQLVSAPKQEFVDRSLLSNSGFFDLGRDLGVNVHGAVLNDKLKYAVFLMNGDGANSLNRNNRALMVGTCLEVPILGSYEYSETDVGYSESPNLGVGLAYAFNEGGSAIQSGTIPASTKVHHGTLDVVYKYRGLSVEGSGVITRKTEGADLTNWGYNAQVGYFLIPKTLEVATRAAGAIFSNATRNQYEYAAVVNYFPWQKGHGIKLQADYALLLNDGGAANINDHRIRVAMNLIF